MSFDSVSTSVGDYFKATSDEYHCNVDSDVNLADATFNYNWLLQDSISGVSFVPRKITRSGSLCIEIHRMIRCIRESILSVDSKKATKQERREMEYFDMSKLTFEQCYERFEDDSVMQECLSTVQNEFDRLVTNAISPQGTSISADKVRRLRAFKRAYTVGGMIDSPAWKAVTASRSFATRELQASLVFILKKLLCYDGRSAMITKLNHKIASVSGSNEDDDAKCAKNSGIFLPLSLGDKWDSEFKQVWPVWGQAVQLHRFCSLWKRVKQEMISSLKSPSYTDREVAQMLFASPIRPIKHLTTTLRNEIREIEADLLFIQSSNDPLLSWYDYTSTDDDSDADTTTTLGNWVDYFQRDDVVAVSFFTDVLGGDLESVKTTMEVSWEKHASSQYSKLADVLTSLYDKLPKLINDPLVESASTLSFMRDNQEFADNASHIMGDILAAIAQKSSPPRERKQTSKCNEVFLTIIKESWDIELKRICKQFDSDIRQPDVTDLDKHISTMITWLHDVNVKELVMQSKTYCSFDHIMESIGRCVRADGEPGMDCRLLREVKTELSDLVPPVQNHKFWDRGMIKWTTRQLTSGFDLGTRKQFLQVAPTDRKLQHKLFLVIEEILEGIAPLEDYREDHQHYMITFLAQTADDAVLLTLDDYVRVWYYISILHFSYAF